MNLNKRFILNPFVSGFTKLSILIYFTVHFFMSLKKFLYFIQNLLNLTLVQLGNGRKQTASDRS